MGKIELIIRSNHWKCHINGHSAVRDLLWWPTTIILWYNLRLVSNIINMATECLFNTMRPRQNGRRFADETFKRIFLNENVRISIKISLKFVPKGPINNNPALVQIMAWRRSGDKPLSEPMMISLLTHICVTRPQWVKASVYWACLSVVKAA